MQSTLVFISDVVLFKVPFEEFLKDMGKLDTDLYSVHFAPAGKLGPNVIIKVPNNFVRHIAVYIRRYI